MQTLTRKMRITMSGRQIISHNEKLPKDEDESTGDTEKDKRVVLEIFKSPDDDSANHTIYIPSSEELTKIVVEVYTRFTVDSVKTRQMRSMTVEFDNHMISENGTVSLRNNTWQTVSEKRRTYE